MTTPDFSGFKTEAIVSSPLEGTRPLFVQQKNYDSRGIEKVEPKTEAEQKQEASFFSKYWMYILAAMFILPRLFEAPPAEGGQAPAAPART